MKSQFKKNKALEYLQANILIEIPVKERFKSIDVFFEIANLIKKYKPLYNVKSDIKIFKKPTKL